MDPDKAERAADPDKDERDEHLPMPIVLCPTIYFTCGCPLTGPCLPSCGSDYE